MPSTGIFMRMVGIAIALAVGLGSGIALGYLGLNPQVEELRAELKIANERASMMEQNVTALGKVISNERLQHTLRVLELNTLLSERRGIRYKALDRTPVYYDTRVALVGEIECTGSMEPTMGCNDVTIGYRPEAREIVVGDVVVFRERTADCSAYTGADIIHRVVGVSIENNVRVFKTKGDANVFPDQCPVSFNDIVIKVIAVVYDAQAL